MKLLLNILGILLFESSPCIALDEQVLLSPTISTTNSCQLVPLQNLVDDTGAVFQSTYSILLEDGTQIDYVPDQGLFCFSPDNIPYRLQGRLLGADFKNLTIESIQTNFLNVKQPLFNSNMISGIHHDQSPIPYIFPDKTRENLINLRKRQQQQPQVNPEDWKNNLSRYLYNSSFFPTSGCLLM